MNALRFHWAAPSDSGQSQATGKYGEGPFSIDAIVEFAQFAEQAGIKSLLMGISYHMPDPIPLLSVLLRETTSIKFILAYRPGLISPTLFSQVVNTLSWIGDSRVDLNIVAGISPAEQAYYGDFCDHSQRYARTKEFLEVVNHLWQSEHMPYSFEGEFYQIRNAELGVPFQNGQRPNIYISGGSLEARDVTGRFGDCLLRYGDTPDKLSELADSLHADNLKLGIRMHVIARETREEALYLVSEMSKSPDEEHRREIAEFVKTCDSQAVLKSFELAQSAENDWLSPMVWSGAVAYRGGPALAIVGSYDEVAEYLKEYRQAGVDEFILSGWPTRDELEIFCKQVIPRYKELEA